MPAKTPLYTVSLDVQEHVGGGTYVERRFSLSLRTTRDLGDLQEILLNAANEANVTDCEEDDDFEVLEAQRRMDQIINGAAHR